MTHRLILPRFYNLESFPEQSNPIWVFLDLNIVVGTARLPRLPSHGSFAAPNPRTLASPVETVLEWLASGMSVADILGDYPGLESEDIYAALSYAARLAQTKRIEPLAAWDCSLASAC